MSNDDLLFLLKGGHMDMPTRIQKGIWPHTPIELKECIKVIESFLGKYSSFPCEWKDRLNGELIDDIDVIMKINDKKYLYRSREASPSSLNVISSESELVFDSAYNAAEYYLRNVMYLPGDLDGWKVV